MLQGLSDLFLLISNDNERITNKDISILYNFIFKIMPQIDQQFPSILLKTLNISYNIKDKADKNKSYFNEYDININTKKTFIHFQKQIIHLFNGLIDYFYKENIIKISTKFEKLIKEKIDNKIREKIHKNIIYDNNYKKEIYIIKEQKNELRKFLIFLILNGEIIFNIYPNQYVNFFNSENKLKNRLYAQQLVKFIKNAIKLNKKYKNYFKKNYNKYNYNTKKKKYYIERKKNKTDEKYKKKNTKNKIEKSINLENKIFNTENKNKNIKSNNLEITRNKHISLSNIYIYDKMFDKKKYFSLNKSENKNNDSSDDEINDTVRCETPKNLDKETKIKINKNDKKNINLIGKDIKEIYPNKIYTNTDSTKINELKKNNEIQQEKYNNFKQSIMKNIILNNQRKMNFLENKTKQSINCQNIKEKKTYDKDLNFNAINDDYKNNYNNKISLKKNGNYKMKTVIREEYNNNLENEINIDKKYLFKELDIYDNNKEKQNVYEEKENESRHNQDINDNNNICIIN